MQLPPKDSKPWIHLPLSTERRILTVKHGEERSHGHPPKGSWMDVGGDQVLGLFISLNESVGMKRLRNHVDKQLSPHIIGSIVVWV